jgi:cysteine desulfurase
MRRIYLDHNATSPLDPRAAAAMAPWQSTRFGNPSSLHFEGREARRAVESARETTAALLGVDPSEITFTGGATEANATVIAAAGARAGGRWLASTVEHASVYEPLKTWADAGGAVGWVAVDASGRLRADALEDALGPPCLGLSLLAANNETGALQPVAAAAQSAARRGAGVHVDAAQMLGKARFRLDDPGMEGVQWAVLSAHKCGGPQGVGVLWTRRGAPFRPLLRGGGQERDRRAGTENVAGIVGFAEAARRAVEELEVRRARLSAAEHAFLSALGAAGVDVHRHGPMHGEDRLPGTLYLRIAGRSGEGMVLGLDLLGVAVGLGSACASGAATPSRVLEAMSVPKAENLESFRVSFGPQTSTDDAVEAAQRLLRHLRPNPAGPGIDEKSVSR